MTEAVRVGVVGLGGMGRAHVENIAKIDGFELVGAADPGPQAQAWAAEQKIRCFSSHVDLIDKMHPDALVVASPSNTHGRVVTDACEQGIHVFCEKPLTTEFSEALRVIRRVEKSGIVFSIGLVLRHTPVYVKARELLEEGEIGQVGLADCRYGGMLLGRATYVFSKELGRGLINEHTIHMIDVMDFLLGPVETVYAAYDADESHTEYNASILMKNSAGSFTSICASGITHLPSYAWITGMEKEMVIDANSRLSIRDEDGEKELLSSGLGYREELEEFRDAILGRGDVTTGIEVAESSSRLIEAIYRSAESGRTQSPDSL